MKIHLLRTAMYHRNISVTERKKRLKLSHFLTNENNIALISPTQIRQNRLAAALFWTAGNQGALPHFHHRYLCHKLCNAIL